MNYRLQDLVDVPILQEMLSKLRDAIPLTFSILDIEGHLIAGTPSQDICSLYHRCNNMSAGMSMQSDHRLSKRSIQSLDNIIYTCPHGLVDSATPIIIDGKYMADLVIGQLFLQQPDEQYFREQARRFGYDEAKYMEALGKVPVITRTELDKNLAILRIFTVMLGDMGMKRLEELKALESAEEERKAASDLINDLYDHAPCGYHSMDGDGLIIRVNDTELSWLGYTREEMVGQMRITDIMTAKTKRAFARKLPEYIKTGFMKNQVAEIIRKDGSILPALINSTAIVDEQGNLVTSRSTMYDITERLHAEAALRKSEEQFRGLFQTMTEGVALHEIIYDESGKAVDYRIAGVNLSYSAQTGIPEEKAAGAVASILYGTGAAPFLDIYSEVAATGKPATFETLFQPLGKHFRISVFSHQKGSFACVFNDITERKLADEALKRSEEQYRLLTENSTDIIMRIDLSGTITYISPSVKKLTGLEPQQLVGKSAARFILTDDKELISTITQELTQKQAPITLEHKYRNKDGSILWLETVVRPIFDGEGNIMEVQAAARDITARKHAEEELKQAKEYAEDLINTANAIVMVMDASGHVIEFNKAAEELTGWTKAEIQGRNWFETLVPRDRYPHVWSKFRHMQEKGFPANFENPILTRSGEERHIVWHNSMLHANGKAAGMVSFGMDVTERRQMETDLRTYKEKLDLILKNLDAVIIQADKNGLLTLLEGRGLTKLNSTQEPLLGRLINDIFKNDPIHIQAVKRVYSGKRATAEYVMDDVVFDLMYTPNFGPDGKQDGVIGLAVDITERKKAEQNLQAEKERLKVTLQSIGDGVIATDSEGKVILMNGVAEELTGWQSHKAQGKKITEVFEIFNEMTGEKCDNPVEKVLSSGNIIGLANHTALRSANGTIRSIADSAAPILDESRRILGVIFVFRDVTEAKNKENDIIYLSYHDRLTGLYNRTFFEEEARRLDTGRQLPISVIMGDVNGLKLTNDVFGHGEGDSLLVRITGILRDCCRTDDIVARVGGDEFCILLPKTSYASASDICKRIYARCEKAEYGLPKGKAKLSISLGCATKLNDQDSVANIIKTAEDSMYRRKLLESRSQHSFLISSIRMTLFEKNYETEQHAQRLISYSTTIAQELNLPDDQINDIELFALLHDIGKIAIDSHILTKTGKLDETEKVEMRRHPEIGFRIAQASPELAHIAEYILCHHERWDGQGYPQGLKGTAIPLLARILIVVDAYDAMTQDRVYRKAMSREQACTELLMNAGTQFDPNIVETFIELLEHNKSYSA